jgi:hypothetical protein
MEAPRPCVPFPRPHAFAPPLTDRDLEASKPLFHSYLIEGALLRDPKSPNKYSVTWGSEHKLKSAHNEAGRGMELSELVQYKG